MQIIIDTNVFFSAIKYRGIPKKALDVSFAANNICFSQELINEVICIFHRYNLSAKQISYFLQIVEQSECFNPDQKISACRDIKDDFLLELAEESGADYLITGDKDLLVLGNWEETKICTPSEFLEECE